jgi:hypothetical protein
VSVVMLCTCVDVGLMKPQTLHRIFIILSMFTLLFLKHAYWFRAGFGVDNYWFNIYELNLNDLVIFCMSFHHGIIYGVCHILSCSLLYQIDFLRSLLIYDMLLCV